MRNQYREVSQFYVMTELKSEEWKGYLWALLGTIGFSSLYVFSKAGLNQVELAQFGLYYFGISFLLNLSLAVTSGRIREIKQFTRKVFALFILLAILDLASNITFFMAIHAIPDPSVTSFMGNLFPVFLTSLGIIFLKERFSLLEALGGLLAISGAFVISYTGELNWQRLFIPGTGWVVINTFLAATFSVLVKKNVQKASPVIFNLNSNAWIFLFFLGYFLVSGQSVSIPFNAFENIALGSFFGSFLGLMSLYYSYRYIEASRSSIVQSLKGIFVLVIAYFYFGNFPLNIQLLGGGITIGGVIVMTLAQGRMVKIGKTKIRN
jgi:drug/metabolite transporter (DMT)-like permease